jgi:hypothetical protein
MNETVTYLPEHLKIAKQTLDRAMRYQLELTENALHRYRASSEILQTLRVDGLVLPAILKNYLQTLIDGVRQNRWQDDPVAGNQEIKHLYTMLNDEMRHLGLL